MAIIRTRRLAVGILPEVAQTQNSRFKAGSEGYVFTAPSGVICIVRHLDMTVWRPTMTGIEWDSDAYAMVSVASGVDVLFAHTPLHGRGNEVNVGISHGSWTGTAVLYEGDRVYVESGTGPLHYQLSGAVLPIPPGFVVP